MRYSISFQLLNLPLELAASQSLPCYTFHGHSHDLEAVFRHLNLAAEYGALVEW